MSRLYLQEGSCGLPVLRGKLESSAWETTRCLSQGSDLERRLQKRVDIKAETLNFPFPTLRLSGITLPKELGAEFNRNGPLNRMWTYVNLAVVGSQGVLCFLLPASGFPRFLVLENVTPPPSS